MNHPRDISISSYNDENDLDRSNDRLTHNTASQSVPTRDSKASSSMSSMRDYIIFCILYSVTHATVDAVVAFSTAELGAILGSYGGFALYISYTMTSLLLAKPFLHSVGPKNSLIVSQICSLVYVLSFFISIADSQYAPPVFIIGAIVGGIGAGFMWTAQGAYFSLSARSYSKQAGVDVAVATTNFASIFSGTYLLLESMFGAMATGVYLLLMSYNTHHISWKTLIFGSYSSVALISSLLFWRFVVELSDDSIVPISLEDVDSSVNGQSTHGMISKSNNNESQRSSSFVNVGAKSIEEEDLEEEFDNEDHESHFYAENKADFDIVNTNPWWEMFHDISSVTRALLFWRPLQLLMSYQISFGLSSGLMNYFVNGFIVKPYIGDGYIGILSAISTITAASIAIPYAYISNKSSSGKWSVMMFSGGCFLFNGILVLIFSNSSLGSWFIMIPYYIIHGAARGAWESTNKAVIAEYFQLPNQRDIAFASIYFASGLAGAFGYFGYHYMSGTAIAALNSAVAFLSIATYHYSTLYMKDVQR